MAKEAKQIIFGILKKMGKEFTPKITEARAQKKLERAIEKDGSIEDIVLDDEEINFLNSIGFEIDIKEEAPAKGDVEPSDKDLEEIEEGEEKPEEKKPDAPKKPAKPKAPPVKKEKRIDRWGAVIKVIKSKKQHQLEDVVKAADVLCVEAGRNSNIKETTTVCRYAVKVLKEFGVLEQKKDKIRII